MKLYPQVVENTIEDHTYFLKQISRLRQEDVQEFTNLQNTFLAGRKVNKIPSASIDVIQTDRVGDFNVTTDYAYYLINNSGTAEWRRVSVVSW